MRTVAAAVTRGTAEELLPVSFDKREAERESWRERRKTLEVARRTMMMRTMGTRGKEELIISKCYVQL